MIEIGNGCKIKNCQISGSRNGKMVVGGKEIPKPPVEMNNVTMINDKVFVGGYEYKDGEWKRTLRALLHKYF
jgi:hypothetical protein